MPGKVHYLDDRRAHLVQSSQFQEFSMLPIEPGPILVVAKGTVQGVNVEFNVGIRLKLEVHAMFSGLMGTDETRFFTDPSNIGPGAVLITSGNPDHNTFTLVVAATLPFEGGGGSGPPPPPHRAVLLAMKDTGGTGAGALTNVKIFAMPLDEIVQTVLT